MYTKAASLLENAQIQMLCKKAFKTGTSVLGRNIWLWSVELNLSNVKIEAL